VIVPPIALLAVRVKPLIASYEMFPDESLAVTVILIASPGAYVALSNVTVAVFTAPPIVTVPYE